MSDTLCRGNKCEREAIAALKAIGFGDGEMFTIGVRNYALQARFDGDRLSLWKTKRPSVPGGDWVLSSPIFGGWDYLVELSRSNDIFILPNKCQNGMSKHHVTRFDVVFFEVDPKGDNIAAELKQNRAFIRELESRGFVLSAQIYSGNKSDHGHLRLTEDPGQSVWENLMRKAAIAMGSDPAIVTLGRKMRFPNVYRTKSGVTRYCKSRVTDAVYTPSELEQWLDTLIKERYGVMPPEVISEGRFRAYKRLDIQGLPKEEVIACLTADEFEFEEKFEDIDLSDIPTEVLHPVAIKALNTIPESVPGEGSYEEIYRRIAGGLKNIFGEAIAVNLLEQHSPQREAANVVRSLTQYNAASLFKAAREYGGFEWEREDAERLKDWFHEDILHCYAKFKGKDLSLELSPLRRKFQLLGCPDQYWKEECNAIAAEINVKPIYGASEEWWDKYHQNLVGLGGSRGEGEVKDTPEWIQQNQIVPWLNARKRKAEYIFQHELKHGDRQIVGIDEIPAHDGTEYQVAIQNEQQRFDIVQKAQELGYVGVVDISPTGTGKTHNLQDPVWQTIKTALFLQSHRSPHVKELSDSYFEMPTRHNGLWRHSDGVLRRNPENEGDSPSVKSNCEKADEFLEAIATGRNLEIDSPCFGCQHFDYCGKDYQDRPAGNGFRRHRFHALRKNSVRAHLTQFQGVSEFLLADRVAIVDEAMAQIGDGFKTMSITFEQIEKKLSFVDRLLTAKSHYFRPFIQYLRNLSEGNTTPYSIGDTEVFENAPPPCDYEEQATLKGVLTANRDGKIDWNYAKQIIEAEREYGNIDFTPDVAVPFEPLSDLIKVWCGAQGAISVHGDTVTVTMPDHASINMLKKFKSVLLMDATPNLDHLAKLWGVSKSKFLVISRAVPDNSRLKITTIETPGTKSRQNLFNSNQTQDRVASIIDLIKEHRGDDVRVLGMKNCPIPHDIYWGKGNRGDNSSAGVKTLISYGLPRPNLVECQSQYIAMYRSLDGFEAYYNHLVAVEVIQLAGRQRAHRYDADFELFMICADFDPSFLEHLGCQVQTIHAAQIDPKLGTESQYRRFMMGQVALELVRTGKDLTQKAIAETLGKSQQAVAKMVKGFAGGWQGFRDRIQPYLNSPTKAGLYFQESDAEFDEWLGFTPVTATALIAPLLELKDWETLDTFLGQTAPDKIQWVLAIALNLFAIDIKNSPPEDEQCAI